MIIQKYNDISCSIHHLILNLHVKVDQLASPQEQELTNTATCEQP